jgi:hypothetical protein
MPLFLTILEGPTPLEARPILAIQDQATIEAVARRLLQRLAHPQRERKAKA